MGGRIPPFTEHACQQSGLGIYAASKAALTCIGETLRLEMAPFDVKVVTAMTGAVTSNFIANAPEYHLPPASCYTPVEKNIADMVKGINLPTPIRAEEYAERVVGDVIGGANGKIWRGAMATTAGWLVMVTPTWLLVRLMRSCGMGSWC